MNIKPLLVIFSFFITHHLLSFHFPNKELAKECKNYDLIVVLKELKVQPLYGEKKVPYNIAVKDIIPFSWRATLGECYFYEPDSLKKLNNLELREKLILSSGWVSNESSDYYWSLTMIDNEGKNKNLLAICYEADNSIGKDDVIFFTQQANKLILAARKGVNGFHGLIDLNETKRIINKKTLYLDSTLTDQKYHKKLLKKYKGELKFLSAAEIQQEIKNRSSKSLHVKVVTSYSKNAPPFKFYMLFETRTGQILGISTAGGSSVSFTGSNQKYIKSSFGPDGVYGMNPNYSISGDDPNKGLVIYKTKQVMKPIHAKVFCGNAQRLNFKYFE